MGLDVEPQDGAPIACSECERERGIRITVSEGQDKVTVKCTVCGAKAEYGVFRDRETVIQP